MFEPVSSRIDLLESEQQCLNFWQKEQTFAKSLQQRQGNQSFTFYEGPPTANGMPHPGHVLTRVMKDVFLRYQSMLGNHVPRRAGWDTHGLPVEVEMEKTLGISGRQAIESYGVEKFTRNCLESVFRYIDEWRRMTQRIGFWVDLDDAYVTFHRSYVESVWWALAELHKKGLLYQDYKVVWWWPQGGTALSAGEVGQGYKSVDDPSVVLRFALKDQPNTSLLAWTTTPWTLPSNIAIAVHPELDYVSAELESGEKVIVAAQLADKVLAEHPHHINATYKGSELCGQQYEPVFSYAEPENGPAYQVIAADFVTLDSGTGLVHIAPAFGEEDFRVAKAAGLGFLQLVNPDGRFADCVRDFAGRFCKEADRDIIRHLKKEGTLFSEAMYRHDYPFCWRKDSDPLIQYARRSWFIRTTAHIEALKANNQHIHWEPEHIRDGRFGSFLDNNIDWALSRERFWGTPLPIWINDETGAIDVVDSVDAILARNPQAFAAFDKAKDDNPKLSEHLRVHKPWIDHVTWTKEGEAGVYRRVPEVIDGWFDSGCMPFAQWGYPHRNQAQFEACFPADFITEAVDQTRGWFYSLLAISSLLFPDQAKPHPFRSCVVMGIISDAKGQKLSKSKKNYDDPMTFIERHGADAVRWALYTGTIPGQNTRFHAGAAVEATRDCLLKLWNVYSFFVTYANIDTWKPTQERPELEARHDLDRWILAELEHSVRRTRHHLDHYHSHLAARELQDFLDSVSNWYVRRSRARFWSEHHSDDKSAAFATLYEVLCTNSKLFAPFVPFITETMHQNLERAWFAQAPSSVHLCDFPEPNEAHRDDALRDAMHAARTVVTLGLRVRAEQNLKVRQPLTQAIVVVTDANDRKAVDRFREAICEELNVHALNFTDTPLEYVDFHILPNFRALGPKLGKAMPACKAALAQASGSELYSAMQRDGHIHIEVDGETLQLGPEEVEIRVQPKEDFAAAAMGGRLVILDTALTEALKREGIAREIINRIQRTRKDMDLPYQARIEVHYHSTVPQVCEAIREHHTLIQGETLATQLNPNDQASAHRVTVEGEVMTFDIKPLG